MLWRKAVFENCIFNSPSGFHALTTQAPVEGSAGEGELGGGWDSQNRLFRVIRGSTHFKDEQCLLLKG